MRGIGELEVISSVLQCALLSFWCCGPVAAWWGGFPGLIWSSSDRGVLRLWQRRECVCVWSGGTRLFTLGNLCWT